MVLDNMQRFWEHAVQQCSVHERLVGAVMTLSGFAVECSSHVHALVRLSRLSIRLFRQGYRAVATTTAGRSLVPVLAGLLLVGQQGVAIVL